MKAFPISNETGLNQQGMDLRDYFAAAALHGLISGQSAEDGWWEMEAKAAYEIADAMMKAREQ